jgi:hypothetical protein
MVTVLKRTNASPRILATKELAVASLQHSVSLPFSPGNFFTKKEHDCRPPPTLLTSLDPLQLLCFLPF